MELKQLYEAGILTKEEMEVEKVKILDEATTKDESPTRKTRPTEKPVSSTTDDTITHKKTNKPFLWRYKYVLYITLVLTLVALGWWAYSHFQQSVESESVEKTADEEAVFVRCVKNWDEMHNSNECDVTDNSPYAETLYFYGQEMSGSEAILKNRELLKTIPDYRQESANIRVTRITDKLVVCDFDKHTYANGKSKMYPSYLYLADVGGGIWKIKEESDLETDKNLQKMRERRNNAINRPITLQFIREYCDSFNLPYSDWEYVKNSFEEQK